MIRRVELEGPRVMIMLLRLETPQRTWGEGVKQGVLRRMLRRKTTGMQVLIERVSLKKLDRYDIRVLIAWSA